MSERENEELHLYFIVRSILMGFFGALVFSVLISFLKTSKLLYVLSDLPEASSSFCSSRELSIIR